MAKFPEAEVRLFRNIFVCKNCKTKMRTPNTKVISGRITCRNCSGHAFRPIKKK